MPPENQKVNLPWWTWIAPFFLILLAKIISVRFFYFDGFFYLYGSYVVALPLYFMWGARVFYGNVLAESITSNLTGLNSADMYIVHGLANAAKPFIGYSSYKLLSRAKILPKAYQGAWIIIFAILIPALLINPILIGLRVGAGDFNLSAILPRTMKQVLRDLIWGVTLSYPFMVKYTPFLKLKNISRWPAD
ncbi:hypothetical protein ACLVWU_06230 [Bdellovibrio sp. HCB290]|uniref:hypothetical protein n=1 Tax=Bdellovibrio sp. HCB290 TaxID=3394356 RepID=UPI0039B494BD